MSAWNEAAKKLEETLMDNTNALMRHLLRTADSDTIVALFGREAFVSTDSSTRESIASALLAQLDNQKQSDLKHEVKAK